MKYIYKDTVKYTDFYEKEVTAEILIVLNFANKRDRQVFSLWNDYHISDDVINNVTKNYHKIVKLIADESGFEKANELISPHCDDTLRVFLSTSDFWEDQRLFEYSSCFCYAYDEYNLCSLKKSMMEYVRDNFYKYDQRWGE